VKLAKNINSAGGKYGGLFTVVKWIIKVFFFREGRICGARERCRSIGFGKTNRMVDVAIGLSCGPPNCIRAKIKCL